MLAHEVKNGMEFIFPARLVKEPGPGGSQVKHLRFPPVDFPEMCAHCGTSEGEMKYAVQDVLARFTAYSRVHVKDAVFFQQQYLVPLCPRCLEKYTRARVIRPLVKVLSVILVVAAFFLFAPVEIQSPEFGGLSGLGLLLLCGLAGYGLGLLILRLLGQAAGLGLGDWPWFHISADTAGLALRFIFKNPDFARTFESYNTLGFNVWQYELTHHLQ